MCPSFSCMRRLQLLLTSLDKDYRLDTRPIRALLEHPRNELLTLEGGCFHYLRRETNTLVPLKGLTSLLRDFYWPSYKPWGRNSSAASTPNTKPAWSTPISAATGSVRGSIVHRQLAEYVRLGRDEFLAENPPTTIHPLVRVALKTLESHHLFPVLAEFKVASEEARLGTAIDLVCIDLAHNCVPAFIEVKTTNSAAGFVAHDPRSTFDGLLGALNAAKHGHLAYSDCTRAKIQLAVSVMMGLEGTGYKGPHSAHVLMLAKDSQIGRLFDVDEGFMVDYGVRIYLDIQRRLPAYRAAKKQERAEKKK